MAVKRETFLSDANRAFAVRAIIITMVASLAILALSYLEREFDLMPSALKPVLQKTDVEKFDKCLGRTGRIA